MSFPRARSYATVTCEAMPQLNAQGLSLLAYAFGLLEAERRPGREWLDALYRESYGGYGFDMLGLDRLVYGIAKVRPGARAAAVERVPCLPVKGKEDRALLASRSMQWGWRALQLSHRQRAC